MNAVVILIAITISFSFAVYEAIVHRRIFLIIALVAMLIFFGGA